MRRQATWQGYLARNLAAIVILGAFTVFGISTPGSTLAVAIAILTSVLGYYAGNDFDMRRSGRLLETTSIPTTTSTTPTTTATTTASYPFLTFGGKEKGPSGPRSNKVFMTNPVSGTSCLHSELPVAAKEIHVFEFQGTTLLACSTDTDNEQDNLQCWKWSGEVWQTFAMETENDVRIWISATQVSDKGINILNNPTLKNKQTKNHTS